MAQALAEAKEFDRALELMEGQEELAALRQETIAARATWERERAIERICREAREGDLGRAADLLHRGVREYPNDARLVAEMTRVARALVEAKEFGRALELMEGQEELAALRDDTIAAKAAWERQQAIDRICREAREGNLGRAADLLRRGVRDYPNDARLVAEMTRVAQALVEAKEFDRALQLMEGQEELAALRGETIAARGVVGTRSGHRADLPRSTGRRLGARGGPAAPGREGISERRAPGLAARGNHRGNDARGAGAD